MIFTRKALVSVGVALGAIAFGAAASAAVDEATDDDTVAETTTTTTTSTSLSSTTTSTTEATTTTDAVPTTEAPTPPEVPATSAVPDDDEVADDAQTEGVDKDVPFGQCVAFSGREQPGRSEAWERLDERAEGDIEAFCEAILADHPGRKGTDAEVGDRAPGHGTNEADHREKTGKSEKPDKINKGPKGEDDDD